MVRLKKVKTLKKLNRDLKFCTKRRTRFGEGEEDLEKIKKAKEEEEKAKKEAKKAKEEAEKKEEAAKEKSKKRMDLFKKIGLGVLTAGAVAGTGYLAYRNKDAIKSGAVGLKDRVSGNTYEMKQATKLNNERQAKNIQEIKAQNPDMTDYEAKRRNVQNERARHIQIAESLQKAQDQEGWKAYAETRRAAEKQQDREKEEKAAKAAKAKAYAEAANNQATAGYRFENPNAFGKRIKKFN